MKYVFIFLYDGENKRTVGARDVGYGAKKHKKYNLYVKYRLCCLQANNQKHDLQWCEISRLMTNKFHVACVYDYRAGYSLLTGLKIYIVQVRN
jgi:hypothetical protein